MTFEQIFPTVLSLAINVPVTLLTTFFFNEWLKNKRVSKDIVLENLKELLKQIQGENDTIVGLASSSYMVHRSETDGLADAKLAKLKEKSDLINNLLNSHAKVMSLMDLVTTQLNLALSKKTLPQVTQRLKDLKMQYGKIWREAVDNACEIKDKNSFVIGYTSMSPQMRRVFTDISDIITIVNDS